MTYIQVPATAAAWPPPGRPVAGFDSFAESRLVVDALVRHGIPGRDLTVLTVAGWRAPGDRVAVLAAIYLFGLALLAMVLGVAAGEPARFWLPVSAVLVLLAPAVALAIAHYFRRRTRRLIATFDPPVSGRHVLLCAAPTAARASALLADPAPG